jgi:stearoyl-CoA desaturase (delta-9 desaturase)
MLVFVPIVGLIAAASLFWAHGISRLDLGLAIGFYLFTGLGITVGYHRLFTHHSFRPSRWLSLVLGIAGSMAIEGSVISWVSQHRRHHAFSDRTGDPHSPVPVGPGMRALLRGLWHAHAGWLFVPNEVDAPRWSRDLLDDRDMVALSSTAGIWAALSLAIPFTIGWVVTGTLWGALMAGLWGGVVRVALLHHVTWGTNSLCHSFGSRPFESQDRSSNLPALALVSFGDSWHNAHHAFPRSARHGVDSGQVDMAAGLIALFERWGWASDVRWPRPATLDLRRVAAHPTTGDAARW